MSKPWAIAIVGATATGKSHLGLQMATHFNGEILCMDSMQIYRRMDIGTAKPSFDEQTIVPHHLLDICEPTDTFTVEDYQRIALETIKAVNARGKVPFLVGGTGLYLRAMSEGLTLGGVKGNEIIREKYNEIANQANGLATLHNILMECDPDTAAKLHPNDVRRVIRAIEIFELTGIPMSKQKKVAVDPPCDILKIGLNMPSEKLRENIEKRIYVMLENGLENEVKDLMKNKDLVNSQALQAIGYKELIPYLRGDITRDEAVRLLIRNTKHYAKRQNTWFRGDSAVNWFDTEDTELSAKVQKLIETWLQERK